ncbi:MAG: hypothetical protein LUG45_04575 [Clostridiales bacterium]|nr:hypothetical protein [Clostridiales bacterium]
MTSEERDYDYAVCKIPRKDKDGNDISSDKIGKGGRHREDGTYSGVAYDIELTDENCGQEAPTPKPTIQYEDLPWWGQLICDVAEEVVPVVMEKLTDVAITSFQNWCRERKSQKSSKNNLEKTKKATIYDIKATRIIRELENTPEEEKSKVIATVAMPLEFDSAYAKYSTDMTSEQAQKELLDAFVLYILSVQKLWKVSHARIVDASGNMTSGKEIVDMLSSPTIIASINSILQHNPKLLEQWQAEALSSIIGRQLLVENQYVPLNEVELKEKLLEKL